MSERQTDATDSVGTLTMSEVTIMHLSKMCNLYMKMSHARNLRERVVEVEPLIYSSCILRQGSMQQILLRCELRSAGRSNELVSHPS